MSIQRLDEIRMVDPVLTTFAQGYTNNQFLAEKIFPIMTVSSSKGKYPVFGKDSFLDRDTDRAIRAKSNRINSSEFVLDEYETTERDIETAIDYLEAEEAYNYYKYEQKVCRDLRDILALSKEKEIADYLQDPINYQSEMKRIISTEEKLISGANPADLISLIKAGKETIRSKISKYPNKMIMGISMLNVLKSDSVIMGLLGNNEKLVSIDFLKEVFEIDEIIFGESVYSADIKTMSDIWQDNIILAYVDKAEENAKSEYNPSFGYTFQKEGMPEIDSYTENGGKIKVIRCTDNYCWKITAPEAGYLISGLL
jgi:hypothetical protein